MDLDEKLKIKIDNMKAVLNTVAGRMVLYDILVESGVDDATFNEDTHKHAMIAGRRETGIVLRNKIKSIDKDKYYLMIRENEL